MLSVKWLKYCSGFNVLNLKDLGNLQHKYDLVSK